MLQEVFTKYDISKNMQEYFATSLYDFVTLVEEAEESEDPAKLIADKITDYDTLLASEAKDMTAAASFRQADVMNKWHNQRKRLLYLQQNCQQLADILTKISVNTITREEIKAALEEYLFEPDNNLSFTDRMIDTAARMLGSIFGTTGK